MRKMFFVFLFLLALCFVSSNLKPGNYFGEFGISELPQDTCQLYFDLYDTLGHSANPHGDSTYILRFYRGILIDSTDGVELRPYIWGISCRAFDTPRLGQYTVVVGWKPCEDRWYQEEGFYNVNYSSTLTYYWGACDGCYQLLYPIGGGGPKDSLIIINPALGDDSLIVKIRFHHSNVFGVYDSLYFFLAPWW